MSTNRNFSIATIACLATLGALSSQSVAATDITPVREGAPVQIAQMDDAQSGRMKDQPCPMGEKGMMQSGMGAHGMMKSGMGEHAMMGPGMEGPGKTKSGMGAKGMMKPSVGGFPDLGDRVAPVQHLSVDDVRHYLEHRLEVSGNKRLMAGEVKVESAGKIIANITTVDGSLVQSIEVDRHTGQMRDLD